VVDEACKQLHADALAAMVSSDEVKVTPECQDDACLKQLVADRGWIAFRPRKATPSAGLIFYPGAAVDPRVYAPILRGVARAGYLVALVPMPGNMALSGSDRVDDVMAGNATPADWFLAGHSLGGIAVLAYVKEHPATSKGFIHWASYGTTEYDIHDVDIPGASIYGARDGRSTVQEVKDGAAFLPAKTSFVRLEGANHAQFGHLCRSEQDQKPDISLEQQHALVQGATVQLMQRALSGDWTTHGGFAKATVEAGLWCQKAQRVLFNPSGDDLPVEKIANQVSTDTTAFSKSSAGIVAKAVSVQTLIRQGANPASLSAPAVIEGEVWCKMKSQDAVAKELGLTPAGAEGSCAEVNKAALAWALSQLSAEELAAYKASGKTLSFLPDEDTKSGPSWILSKMQFKQSTASPGTYELRSTRIMVGDDPAVPEAKRQVYYCKLWAPARALLWALAQR
jgi:hypothetical protein